MKPGKKLEKKTKGERKEGRGWEGGGAGLTGQRVTMKGWGVEERREGKERKGRVCEIDAGNISKNEKK